MPVVRIDIRQGRSWSEKQGLLDAVHAALVEAFGIPDHDRIQRLCEHGPEAFEIPPGKTERFTLVELTVFRGRSADAKRCLYAAIVRNLADLGIEPSDVVIVVHEPAMENWGVRGGQPASDVDPGFRVDV